MGGGVPLETKWETLCFSQSVGFAVWEALIHYTRALNLLSAQFNSFLLWIVSIKYIYLSRGLEALRCGPTVSWHDTICGVWVRVSVCVSIRHALLLTARLWRPAVGSSPLCRPWRLFFDRWMQVRFLVQLCFDTPRAPPHTDLTHLGEPTKTEKKAVFLCLWWCCMWVIIPLELFSGRGQNFEALCAFFSHNARKWR